MSEQIPHSPLNDADRAFETSILARISDTTCNVYWNGRRVSAVIYLDVSEDVAPDNYVAQVDFCGSVKLISAPNLTELRNHIFWIDRVLDRFIEDCVLVDVKSPWP